MSCFGNCGNSDHVSLKKTWTKSGSLQPSNWYPFHDMAMKPKCEKYTPPGTIDESYTCAGCSNPTNFTTSSTSWTRGGNVTPGNYDIWKDCVVHKK